jgi:hypothetical protein
LLMLVVVIGARYCRYAVAREPPVISCPLEYECRDQAQIQLERCCWSTPHHTILPTSTPTTRSHGQQFTHDAHTITQAIKLTCRAVVDCGGRLDTRRPVLKRRGSGGGVIHAPFGVVSPFDPRRAAPLKKPHTDHHTSCTYRRCSLSLAIYQERSEA